jgi:hypothetical protein
MGKLYNSVVELGVINALQLTSVKALMKRAVLITIALVDEYDNDIGCFKLVKDKT